MNYGEIKLCDIANGEGVRVSLFVSGCTHHCKNCFNPQTWSFDYGEPFTKEVEDKILKELEPSYIDGLSLLGGEPFEPSNQRALVPFLKRVREKYSDKTIWCYSGYLFDKELLSDSRARCECTDEMLSMIDVPFLKRVREKYSDKTIWCYSGYLFDKELLSDSRARCECTDEMLSMIDVLVDGEFVEALHDISLAFRGSSNQRIIDVKASLKENKIIPHKLMKRGV